MDEPKIIFPDIATEPHFALDEVGCYGSNTTYFIPHKDKYLLALLNARLGQFYFEQNRAGLEGKNETYLRFFGQYLERFPVFLLNMNDSKDQMCYERIVSLVEEMISAKQNLSTMILDAEVNRLELAVENLERQIDEAVYEFYGLTEEEIKIVEGKK